MRIGELARRTGITPRALRYYEEHGLIVADRQHNGYRDYPEQAVITVRNIQQLLDSGLLIKQIKQLGECVRHRDLATEPACLAAVEAYLARRDAVAERITELHDQHRRLSDTLHHLQASLAR